MNTAHGIKKASPQKAAILPKWFSHMVGIIKGKSAMERSMHTKGITQTISSFDPSSSRADDARAVPVNWNRNTAQRAMSEKNTVFCFMTHLYS